jgi:integrase/recombinase XerD
VLQIYRRIKDKATGQWRAEKVAQGRGIRTGSLTGPFFVRPWINGKQDRHALHSETFADAQAEAAEYEKLVEAQNRGLSVDDVAAQTNSNRISVKSVVQTYLEQKKNKAKKTQMQYRLALNEFLESLGKVKFLDEINVGVLRAYKDFLVAKGFAGKTIDTRVNIVAFLLKKNGVVARVPKDEMPAVEVEAAVPYTEEELRKLFGEMTTEEKVQYKFFLGSACRDREVTFASWADIDFGKGTYTVRSKPEVGFTVKNHESRTVPLPDSLLKLLKNRRKKMPDSRWIFTNGAGSPANHFLRRLKKIALRAGLNCGQCTTTIMKGKYKWRKLVTVTCKTDPVCEHIYLHRLRKTCATRWAENGIPVRTIQYYLGHSSLETTTLYLGVADSDKMRDKINQAAGD